MDRKTHRKKIPGLGGGRGQRRQPLVADLVRDDGLGGWETPAAANNFQPRQQAATIEPAAANSYPRGYHQNNRTSGNNRTSLVL